MMRGGVGRSGLALPAKTSFKNYKEVDLTSFIQNPSFESPVVSGWQSITPTAWTTAGGDIVGANGNAYGNPPAPDGTQLWICQIFESGQFRSLSQVISVPTNTVALKLSAKLAFRAGAGDTTSIAFKMGFNDAYTSEHYPLSSSTYNQVTGIYYNLVNTSNIKINLMSSRESGTTDRSIFVDDIRLTGLVADV